MNDLHASYGSSYNEDELAASLGRAQRSEGRYRALIEVTGQVVWTWSPERNTNDLSPAREWWQALTGQSVEEQLENTTNWLKVVHPEDREAAGLTWQAALVSGRSFTFDFRVKSRGEGWRHIVSRGAPIRDEGGGIREWLGTLNDVTESRQVKADLERRDTQFRRLTSASIIGVIRWDLDRSVIVEANDEFLRMTGYDRADLESGLLDFRAMTPPEWTARNETGIKDLREKGIGGAYEKEYFRKDGGRVPVIIIGVRFEETSSEGMSWVLDITERKKVEIAVREARTRYQQAAEENAKFRAFFEQGTQFAAVLTVGGVVVEVNLRFLDAAGYRREDVVGKSFWECEWWHHDAHLQDMIRRGHLQAASGQLFRTELSYVYADARQRTADLVLAPVADDDGRILFVAATGTDITERRAMEDLLRANDRKKDEFLALISHELRNPLAPLRNGLQVMRLADDPALWRRAREIMDRQLDHMVRLVDDLLDVSRISLGKLRLRRAHISLMDAVISAEEAVRPLIEAAEQTLNISLPSEPIYLDADLTRLAQILGNLLINSSKYSNRKAHIWLTARCESSQVIVTVKDEGIGIPPDSLDDIFGMFSQLGHDGERTGGGLGLGLALVKILVTMHNGTITAESAGTGRGSTFTIRLPASQAEQPQAMDLLANEARDVKPRVKILIVDDNQDGASSFAMLLGILGYESRIARDGLEAIDVAQKFRPMIILMDLGMPKLNGLDATRRIREEPWGKDMIIITVSGWGQESDQALSKEAGCDDHLVKPVGLADLEKCLQKYDASRKEF